MSLSWRVGGGVITRLAVDDMNEPTGPQKIARIRVPREKFLNETKDALWSDILRISHGRYSVSLIEDDESCVRDDKVIIIEGDHSAVEPIIHKVMAIVQS